MSFTDTYFPTVASLPDSVELVHCQLSGRIVGIRLDSGSVLYVDNMSVATITYDGPLRKNETAVPYVLGRQADKERADEVDAETERLADVAETERLAQEDRITALENDVSAWKQRAADLTEEVDERQSRVEELCERVAELEARG